MPIIYSMLSNDQAVAIYEPLQKGENTGVRRTKTAILIKGGANVTDKRMNKNRFEATEVSKEDLDLLKADHSFKQWVEKGFMTVDKKPNESELKKDKSAPMTEKELKAKNPKATVVTNEEKPE